jgi:hypothetical protein
MNQGASTKYTVGALSAMPAIQTLSPPPPPLQQLYPPTANN